MWQYILRIAIDVSLYVCVKFLIKINFESNEYHERQYMKILMMLDNNYLL